MHPQLQTILNVVQSCKYIKMKLVAFLSKMRPIFSQRSCSSWASGLPPQACRVKTCENDHGYSSSEISASKPHRLINTLQSATMLQIAVCFGNTQSITIIWIIWGWLFWNGAWWGQLLGKSALHWFRLCLVQEEQQLECTGCPFKCSTESLNAVQLKLRPPIYPSTTASWIGLTKSVKHVKVTQRKEGQASLHNQNLVEVTGVTKKVQIRKQLLSSQPSISKTAASHLQNPQRPPATVCL